MAFTDIFFNPQNNHSSYYVVDQNTYPANNMRAPPTQIVFINQSSYQPQNQDCNPVYNYYPNSNTTSNNNNSSNNSNNSNSIQHQQQSDTLTYSSPKENQVFYSSPPVKEFINNYQSPTSQGNILVHDSHSSSAPTSERYTFQTTSSTPSYSIMTPSPQPSEYHSTFTQNTEKNNIFIIQPMQASTSNSSSSFSSDESVYLFEDEIRNRKMAFAKNEKKRKNASPMSEKKHLCPYCEHRSKRKHNLIEHILTHNPHRPKKFLCGHCSRPFARKYDMKRHEKIHTR